MTRKSGSKGDSRVREPSAFRTRVVLRLWSAEAALQQHNS